MKVRDDTPEFIEQFPVRHPFRRKHDRIRLEGGPGITNMQFSHASRFAGDPAQRSLSVDRYTLGVEKAATKPD